MIQVIPKTIQVGELDLNAVNESIKKFTKYLINEWGFVSDGKFFYSNVYRDHYKSYLVSEEQEADEEYVANNFLNVKVDDTGYEGPAASGWFQRDRWFVRKKIKGNKKCYIIQVEILYDYLDTVPRDFEYHYETEHYKDYYLEDRTREDLVVEADQLVDYRRYLRIDWAIRNRKNKALTFDQMVPDLVHSGKQQLHVFRPMVSIVFTVGTNNFEDYQEFASNNGFGRRDFGIYARKKNDQHTREPSQRGYILYNQLRNVKKVEEIEAFLKNNFERIASFLEI